MTDKPLAMSEDTRPPAAAGLAAIARRFAPLAVILAGLVFAYLMGWQRFFSIAFLAESRESLTAFVQANYLLATGGFAVLYALAVAFSFPAASVLTIFGGFLFGWLVGGLLVAVGATTGATAIFLAARSAFGDFLRARVGGRVKALADGFEEDAFSYLLVLRLAPVFPFFVINIAPALFNVPLRVYVLATFIGILPGTFAYAYLGQGVGSVLEAAEAAGTTVTLGDLVTSEITLAFVALAVVAAIPLVVKRLRGRTNREAG
ncbi:MULTISPECIES: TVP38/TMEM64 family protein [unclassified Roseitalea]|uniref:TVP38/TMEM64 family protein n=1 Tax=unclassified Roseitalea TaxID=2639107 RepID=UPI00273E5259|nr:MULTISPECIES: TVP38/TMEM64 family protein [unclassified Roseitalea]